MNEYPINNTSGGLAATPAYQHLLDRISETYEKGRQLAIQAVDRHMVETYWTVGHDIVEYEQAGNVKAEYGKALIDNLARDLTLRHGRGFSRSNVIRFRQFYLAYPISATVSHQLSWSHIVELLKIDDPLERGFYEKQSINERWSIRELILSRQKDELLVEYATYQINSQLFVQKYQLYLPNREELRKELESSLQAAWVKEGSPDAPDSSDCYPRK